MTSHEQDYFDALKRIATAYKTPDQIRRSGEREYGLEFTEALEMAYENIIQDAKNAIRGHRRPR